MADILGATAEIVSAHVGRNKLASDQLPGLIRSVYGALTVERQSAPAPAKPAVPVRSSVFDDRIVCLECGRSFRALKRHLERAHEITQDGYRARFGLPRDYPLVAPGYSSARSAIAKRANLGRNRSAEKPDHGRKWVASGESTLPVLEIR